jgi:hypothetical protein
MFVLQIYSAKWIYLCRFVEIRRKYVIRALSKDVVQVRSILQDLRHLKYFDTLKTKKWVVLLVVF